MPNLTYTDAYLTKHIDDDREERAYTEVDEIATFPAPWRDRLTVLRAYISACLDHQGDPEDLFGAKLKHYRAEFERVLVQANAARASSTGNAATVFSIPLERG